MELLCRATIAWKNRNGNKFTNFFKTTEADLEGADLAEAERRQSDPNARSIAQLQRSVAETNRRMQDFEQGAGELVSGLERGIRRRRR